VPNGDVLGFVILSRDGVEVMYQTFDSVRGDEAKVLDGSRAIGASAVFFEVDDLDAIAGQIPSDTEVIVARRKTFYGSTETSSVMPREMWSPSPNLDNLLAHSA
jgi:hypothetical protein